MPTAPELPTFDRMATVRILHIIASANKAGGGPIEGIFRQEEATGGQHPLAVRELVTLDEPEASDINHPWLRINRLGRTRATGTRNPVRRLMDRYRYSPTLVPWLEQNVHRFDYVLVHGLWNYAAMAASRVLPRQNVPYFVFSHGMMDPWFRRFYPVKHVIKQLLWFGYEGKLLAGAASVLFTCEEERRLARTTFLGHRYRETVVGYGSGSAPPAISNIADRIGRAIPGLRGRRHILYISRIHEKKGCDMLIPAFAKVAAIDPDLQLVIAGPGDAALVRSLQDQARAAGIDERIHWPGGLFGDDKWAAFQAAEAFILPSHQENFGIAVAEALSCGLPVLITDKVNIWREIEAAGAGLVTDDTAPGIERQLREWLALDADARKRMSAAAVALFQNNYDIKKFAPALLLKLGEIAADGTARHDQAPASKAA